jgi:hypothetical protein
MPPAFKHRMEATMSQQQTSDPVVSYAEGLDDIWRSWDGASRAASSLLSGAGADLAWDDEAGEQLSRLQYKANVAVEFAAELEAPMHVAQLHAHLVTVLEGCRDALGSLAHRAELRDLDEQSCTHAARVVAATREAFANCHHVGTMPLNAPAHHHPHLAQAAPVVAHAHASYAAAAVPAWSQPGEFTPWHDAATTRSPWVWGLAATAGALLLALGFEVATIVS